MRDKNSRLTSADLTVHKICRTSAIDGVAVLRAPAPALALLHLQVHLQVRLQVHLQVRLQVRLQVQVPEPVPAPRRHRPQGEGYTPQEEHTQERLRMVVPIQGAGPVQGLEFAYV
jgi:hypothetical protein